MSKVELTGLCQPFYRQVSFPYQFSVNTLQDFPHGCLQHFRTLLRDPSSENCTTVRCFICLLISRINIANELIQGSECLWCYSNKEEETHPEKV